MNLSIIILNINGADLLKNCIKSILRSNLIKSKSKFEIIIFDNGSNINEIESYKSIKKLDSRIKIMLSKKNLGPAKARNLASNKAKYKYICYLDNDTEVDKNFHKKPLSIYKKNNNIGIIQLKLLKYNTNKFDYAGDYISNYGILKRVIDTGKIDFGQIKTGTQILSAKSAGMFISKKAFLDSGGFDKDYFIYCEETDLGWRVCLKGYKNIFCNESVVYHHWSSSAIILSNIKDYLNFFHGSKNYIITLYKNVEAKNQYLTLYVIFFWIMLSLFYFLTFKFKRSYYILSGIRFFLFNIKKINKKRKTIQKKRLINDKELFKNVKKKTTIIQLIRNTFQI